jgi:iron complex transport system ATP-binding protein
MSLNLTFIFSSTAKARFGFYPNMELVRLENISFRRNGQEILAGISWSINRGEKWAILGPNGCGKSTLLQIIAGMEWPSFGEAFFERSPYRNYPVSELRRSVELFQPARQQSLLQKSLTASDIVCSGELRSLGIYQEIPQDTRNRAYQLLREDNLDNLADKPFRVLSSGEKRRVIYLRSVMAEPRLLLLDEPFESLDLPSREKLMRTISPLTETEPKAKGVPYTPSVNGIQGAILVSHRLEEIPPSFGHILLLKNGKVLASGTKNDLMRAETISELYDWPVDIHFSQGRYYPTPKF